MAAHSSKPSDLYKCVYSFLLENKFTKAAQQFLKQTNVVSGPSGVGDGHVSALSGSRCTRRSARGETWC